MCNFKLVVPDIKRQIKQVVNWNISAQIIMPAEINCIIVMLSKKVLKYEENSFVTGLLTLQMFPKNAFSTDAEFFQHPSVS